MATNSSPGQANLAALLEPDSSILERLLLAASVAAQTCRSLSANDLRSCATQLFNVPAECELASAFVMAYQNERRQIAKRRLWEPRV